VGRPNAGKSSFINALIGKDRYIVTDIAEQLVMLNDTKFDRFGLNLT
jgi:GTP-binding protein